MNKLLSGITGIALSCMALLASAGPLNGSFESGLDGWSTLGQTTTVKGLGALAPTAGNSAAFLSTSDDKVVKLKSIKKALDLKKGVLENLGSEKAKEGSVIYQKFMGSAGDIISFDFMFVTDEEPGSDYDDFAFVSILVDNVLTSIASVQASILNASTIAHGEGGAAVWGDAGDEYPKDGDGLVDTGWLSFSHKLTTSGTVMLGIGVMDVKDTQVESGLMVDNIKSVPEPGALTLLLLGLMGLGLRKRLASRAISGRSPQHAGIARAEFEPLVHARIQI